MFALVLWQTSNLRASEHFSSSRISRPGRPDKNCDLNANLSSKKDFNTFFILVPSIKKNDKRGEFYIMRG